MEIINFKDFLSNKNATPGLSEKEIHFASMFSMLAVGALIIVFGLTFNPLVVTFINLFDKVATAYYQPIMSI
ncbi:hypothetical protein AB3N02_22245 [Priestia aryabhattai]|uniref:hypothetical protein n=1 Tax=Priestia aryabhattai TaxID=412384 RepID=UPI0039A12312